jgi:hypothetical protein
MRCKRCKRCRLRFRLSDLVGLDRLQCGWRRTVCPTSVGFTGAGPGQAPEAFAGLAPLRHPLRLGRPDRRSAHRLDLLKVFTCVNGDYGTSFITPLSAGTFRAAETPRWPRIVVRDQAGLRRQRQDRPGHFGIPADAGRCHTKGPEPTPARQRDNGSTGPFAHGSRPKKEKEDRPGAAYRRGPTGTLTLVPCPTRPTSATAAASPRP